ncbi:hypothetical protein [Jatrophihabitans lederbergiae]|uniref:Carboxylate--amine ligase n=1 Tax=Jatrophihabitans lederbergiae TaxID=3075547 RepID=A0ABU2JDY1_9ACTN|nr:hypothetical protein [Jatrophihabitans sp. DSM 44399]MDT0262684.1 hypothetical protein [Jatrophihabitans sp. DSM 44399]
MADVCTDVEDAVLIAALARALVDTASADWVSGKPTPAIRTALLRAASWRAARSGLSGELIDPRSGAPVPAWTLLEDLLQLLAAALERSGDEGLVRGGFTRLREHGTGADRQRVAFGPRQSLEDVVSDTSRRTLSS